jgi:hypothetical protein
MDLCGSQSAISQAITWSRNWRSASKHSVSVSGASSGISQSAAGGSRCSASSASGADDVSGIGSSAPLGSVGSAPSVANEYSGSSATGLRRRSSSFSTSRLVCSDGLSNQSVDQTRTMSHPLSFKTSSLSRSRSRALRPQTRVRWSCSAAHRFFLKICRMTPAKTFYRSANFGSSPGFSCRPLYSRQHTSLTGDTAGKLQSD